MRNASLSSSTSSLVLVLATLACGLASSPAGAQQGSPPPTTSPLAQQQPGTQQQRMQLKPHLLVANVPGAQDCPAPDWIVPGMRLTYFSSVAQVNDAAGSVGLVEDPNGNIVDANGKRYRQGSAVGLGTGGAGWDCVDVIAVEPGVVVLDVKSFFNTNGLQGPVTSSGSSAAFVHPSGCDYFLHPRLLAQLQQQSVNGVNLIKGTMEHRGGTYDIVLSSVESSGTRMSSVYDLRSGVALSHNSSSQFDRGVTYTQSGDNYDPQRNTSRSLANNQFYGARRINTPWATQQVPAWARTMKTARYQGQRIDSGTPEMGLGRIVSNLSIEYATGYVGQTFVGYTFKRTEQLEGLPAMEPITGLAAVGPGTIGGLWMDPAALSQLRSGTLIDHDANTGVKLGVDFAGAGADGKPIVVIASGNELYKIACTYDAASGKLLQFNKTERSASTGGTITTQLQLVGMQ